ncbi:1-acylglycerol-3-phosphate O-acyltransferase [Phlyctochytrium planicorne]|nr:1-acylglycerol-3-phosphate O-acyltransferase [Phlyctochytrium planicorne]
MSFLMWALVALIIGFNISSRVRFYTKIVIFIATIGVSCIFGMVMAVFLKAAGRGSDANRYIAWCIATLAPPLLGLNIKVEGRENLENVPRPAVFISNHQSELDLVMLGAFLPQATVVMAKSDIKWVPLMGQYMMLAENVFIDRKNLKNAMDTMKSAGQQLNKRKLALFMYPEGTRSYQTTNEMLPLKKGAFHLAIQEQIPIVPIVVSSYNKAYNLKHALFEGGDVRIRILPKIDTNGLKTEDVDNLSKSTHELMSVTLREISAPVPPFAEPLKLRAPKAKKE